MMHVLEFCPKCSSPFELNPKEIGEFVERQAASKEKKEYEAYVEYSKILALPANCKCCGLLHRIVWSLYGYRVAIDRDTDALGKPYYGYIWCYGFGIATSIKGCDEE